MSVLRMIYLGLAVWGAVHPMSWIVAHWRDSGFGLRALVDGWTANAAATGLAWDLVIAAIALSVWILAETWVRRNWLALMAIPATFLVGLSFGLPLYLFLRTRPVG